MSSSADLAPPQAGFGRAAWLYLAHVALLTASLAIFGLFFNFAVLAFGFSLDFLGLLTSLSFLASAGAGAPLLWMLAHIPLRTALLASSMLQLVGMLLFAAWPGRVVLLLASVLLGVGAVLFELSAAPFMMRHSPAGARSQLFSANAAVRIGLAGVGSLLAGQLPALAGRLLSVPADSAPAYQLTLACAAVGVLLAMLPLVLIAEVAELPVKVTPAQLTLVPAAWRDLLRRPGPLLALLVSPALISVGAALLLPFLNLFFKQRFSVSDPLLGLIFAGVGMCTGLAALAAPWLARRWGALQTIVITEALALPFLVLLGVAPSLGMAVGAALARAALFNMGAPLYDAFAMERSEPAARPTVIALINAAYSVGYLFGPLISTLVQARYGFGPLFTTTMILYILGVTAKYWLFLRK